MGPPLKRMISLNVQKGAYVQLVQNGVAILPRFESLSPIRSAPTDRRKPAGGRPGEARSHSALVTLACPLPSLARAKLLWVAKPCAFSKDFARCGCYAFGVHCACDSLPRTVLRWGPAAEGRRGGWVGTRRTRHTGLGPQPAHVTLGTWRELPARCSRAPAPEGRASHLRDTVCAPSAPPCRAPAWKGAGRPQSAAACSAATLRTAALTAREASSNTTGRHRAAGGGSAPCACACACACVGWWCGGAGRILANPGRAQAVVASAPRHYCACECMAGSERGAARAMLDAAVASVRRGRCVQTRGVGKKRPQDSAREHTVTFCRCPLPPARHPRDSHLRFAGAYRTGLRHGEQKRPATAAGTAAAISFCSATPPAAPCAPAYVRCSPACGGAARAHCPATPCPFATPCLVSARPWTNACGVRCAVCGVRMGRRPRGGAEHMGGRVRG